MKRLLLTFLVCVIAVPAPAFAGEAWFPGNTGGHRFDSLGYVSYDMVDTGGSPVGAFHGLFSDIVDVPEYLAHELPQGQYKNLGSVSGYGRMWEYANGYNVVNGQPLGLVNSSAPYLTVVVFLHDTQWVYDEGTSPRRRFPTGNQSASVGLSLGSLLSSSLHMSVKNNPGFATETWTSVPSDYGENGGSEPWTDCWVMGVFQVQYVGTSMINWTANWWGYQRIKHGQTKITYPLTLIHSDSGSIAQSQSYPYLHGQTLTGVQMRQANTGYTSLGYVAWAGDETNEGRRSSRSFVTMSQHETDFLAVQDWLGNEGVALTADDLIDYVPYPGEELPPGHEYLTPGDYPDWSMIATDTPAWSDLGLPDEVQGVALWFADMFGKLTNPFRRFLFPLYELGKWGAD